MAKLMIVLEDVPEGVAVSCFGEQPPKDKQQQTEAQRMAFAMRDALQEHAEKHKVNIH
ncbi:hypothetical protein [Bergeriella denitrificans]|uniref:Uncharacterized protein n=1 Tax=Bergeriella denitrificans TaxID=494 RepID=A0A378URH9_BERDE|nr:hypothetical protein [Bergeriella denitrificans]STZ74807.1 Uncharacterised protein [Bergeriella denitrificans]STZ77514.1 Uncharacterised protein [Bergeriella denitrificans]STZ83027.1 Uncharacterised protein [Bergeriella denitrificans]STZ83071.1 Uncharacterised protein [Bergeriella denitrificans]STZ83106.1 Uncharacterised protein [Bergeriella denitrificans]